MPRAGYGIGSDLSFFADRSRVLATIGRIAGNQWNVSCANDIDSLEEIMGKYQEQSALLNPHLEEMVSPLFEGLLRIYLPLLESQKHNPHQVSIRWSSLVELFI
jgi:hypothetical protein